MSDNPPLKVCLLGATFSTNNLGVSALTASAIHAVLHRFPDAEVFLLDYGKQAATYPFRNGDKTVVVPLLNLRFSKQIFLRNHVLRLIGLALIARLAPPRLRNRIVKAHPFLREIEQADVVAALSGGDSFSDIYGLGRLLYFALPQILVLLMGKKLILLPQTFGPFKSRIAKFVAKGILTHCEAIYSRDYAAASVLRKSDGLVGQNNRIRFCHDLGFVLPPAPPSSPVLEDMIKAKRSGACLVGLNVSGLLFMGGYTRNNMFGLRVDYKKLVREILEHLMRKPEVSVVLVPHVFGTADHAESDVTACEMLYSELRPIYDERLLFARGRFNESEIKHVIGQCDFFIGARMHACIAALSQCIPAVAVAYSDKFIGVMQTIGAQGLVADPRKSTERKIIELIDQALAQRQVWQQRLSAIMPQVKARVLNLFREIVLLPSGNVACESMN